MAQGDSKSSIVSVAGGSTATVQPATGDTWKVETAGQVFTNLNDYKVLVTDGTNTKRVENGASGDLTRLNGALGAFGVAGYNGGAIEWQASAGGQYIDDSYYIQFQNDACSSATFHLNAIQVK